MCKHITLHDHKGMGARKGMSAREGTCAQSFYVHTACECKKLKFVNSR